MIFDCPRLQAFCIQCPLTLINYLFGTSNVEVADECCFVYKDLIDILSANDDDVDRGDGNHDNNNNNNNVLSEEEKVIDQETKENEVVIESILGHSGDTMSKARLAMAAFCRLIETWCLETQRIQS